MKPRHLLVAVCLAFMMGPMLTGQNLVEEIPRGLSVVGV